MNENVTINENGQRRRITKQEAAVKAARQQSGIR
jgi:hypothetical protein